MAMHAMFNSFTVINLLAGGSSKVDDGVGGVVADFGEDRLVAALLAQLPAGAGASGWCRGGG